MCSSAPLLPPPLRVAEPILLTQEGSHPITQKVALPSVVHGGGSRIRTHVPDLREAVFKTAALSHSAIPP